jgi:RNA polymerase sigma factor (sigma-70 family)
MLPQGQNHDPSKEIAGPLWSYVVQRIQHGDQEAMAELYSAFGRGVRFLLARKLGPQDVEDQVHDTFIIVLHAIKTGQVRQPERLMSFVRTVVRRQIAEGIGTLVQARRDEADLDPEMVDTRANPEQGAIGRQQEALMRRVLRELCERDRQVLARFYLHEQSQEQICRDMNLSETQFRLLKSRAKARFAELGKRTLRRNK